MYTKTFNVIDSKEEYIFLLLKILISLLTVTMINPKEQIISVFDMNSTKAIYE